MALLYIATYIAMYILYNIQSIIWNDFLKYVYKYSADKKYQQNVLRDIKIIISV